MSCDDKSSKYLDVLVSLHHLLDPGERQLVHLEVKHTTLNLCECGLPETCQQLELLLLELLVSVHLGSGRRLGLLGSSGLGDGDSGGGRLIEEGVVMQVLVGHGLLLCLFIYLSLVELWGDRDFGETFISAGLAFFRKHLPKQFCCRDVTSAA